MSGGDSSSSTRTRASGEFGGGPDCRDLAFSTTLASPNPDEVDALKVGEILGVDLVDEGGVTIVGVLGSGGALIGSVVSGRLADLRTCLQQGFRFGAEIQSVVGGVVRVRISARE